MILLHSDIEGATLLYFWKEYYLMKQTNWFYNPLMGRELKFEKHQTSRRFDGKHIIQKKDIKAEAEEVGGSQPNGWNKYSKNIGKMVFRVQTESLVQLGDEGQSSDKEGKPGDWVLIVFSLLMWGQEFVGATPDSFCFSCELGRHLLSVGGEVNRQRTKSLEKRKRDDKECIEDFLEILRALVSEPKCLWTFRKQSQFSKISKSGNT